MVKQYREAGWFEHEAGTDEEVAEAARERWWAEWEREVDINPPDDGIFISMAGPQRALWFDPERDTCEENKTYTEVLGDLADLSGGTVVISDVVEDWHRESGRVFVSYRLSDANQEMALHEFDDWVDPKIIAQLNAALPPEGRRLYVFDGGGQAFAVTWATFSEAAALSSHGRATLLDRAPEAWPGVHSE
jgi:hypothetical protein